MDTPLTKFHISIKCSLVQVLYNFDLVFTLFYDLEQKIGVVGWFIFGLVGLTKSQHVDVFRQQTNDLALVIFNLVLDIDEPQVPIVRLQLLPHPFDFQLQLDLLIETLRPGVLRLRAVYQSHGSRPLERGLILCLRTGCRHLVILAHFNFRSGIQVGVQSFRPEEEASDFLIDHGNLLHYCVFVLCRTVLVERALSCLIVDLVELRLGSVYEHRWLNAAAFRHEEPT